jgi:hypothetical protein
MPTGWLYALIGKERSISGVVALGGERRPEARHWDDQWKDRDQEKLLGEVEIAGNTQERHSLDRCLIATTQSRTARLFRGGVHHHFDQTK